MSDFEVDLEQRGSFIEMTVSGTLNARTYELLGEHVGRMIAEHAPVRILFIMSNFHGWTVPGMWKDLVFDVKHRHEIDRVALVGERVWQHGLAYLCRSLIGAQLRYFDAEHVDDARSWLAETTDDEGHDEAPAELVRLLERFADEDGHVREAARHEVAKIGAAAVPALTRTARSGRWQVRWEAVKTLAEIDSETTIAPLVAALHDGDDVRWIAAERLRYLGRAAIEAVLRDLVRHANSIGLCHGAHHVLAGIDDPALGDVLAPVIEALEQLDPAEGAPVAAHAALRRLDEIGAGTSSASQSAASGRRRDARRRSTASPRRAAVEVGLAGAAHVDVVPHAPRSSAPGSASTGSRHMTDVDQSSIEHAEADVLRVLRTHEQTRSYYNKIARVYDLLSERAEQPMRHKGLDMLAATAGETMLEVGCGTGHCLVELARSVGPSGRVEGVDLAENMVQLARELVTREEFDGRVTVQRGDASALSYEDDTFDGIFLSFVLELFDTPELGGVVRELRRVLRPGGRLVVVAVSKEGGPGVMVNFFEWTHKHFPNLVDCRPIHVRRALEAAGLIVRDAKIDHMWVPVEIVRAEEPDPEAARASA